jgi:hypothetical protein
VLSMRRPMIRRRVVISPRGSQRQGVYQEMILVP